MSERLSAQAERFYEVFSDLVRSYQFRDRNSITCHGVSVSQCYVLQAVAKEGALATTRLARMLHLDVSTMTRIVDSLATAGLVERVADTRDRRVRLVRTTRQGRAQLSRIRADLLREYRDVLQEVPAGSREAVIGAISRILDAFRTRTARACAAGSSGAGSAEG
jgi:DNA-binding MarR family transcriptional regulator